MPREHFAPGARFLPRSEILSYEEIARVARVAVELGVRKLRVTGGEPLLRADLPTLVRSLAALGVDLALTTNGSLLARDAALLRDAGLGRLTVSLDSLDDATFRRMNDVGVSVAAVLDGIAAAEGAGFGSLKINCVVQRGVNDAEIVPLARRFRGTGHVLRFIEYMDVGRTNGWQARHVVSGAEIVERVTRELPLEPIPEARPSGVARRYRYRDGSGEIGVITSVTAPFCGDCTRARLSADGQLYTCLFAGTGTDVRAALRASESSDAALGALLRSIWSAREDRYSELRGGRPIALRKVEMSYIGG